MKASIVVPVWNGESVIAGCLEALYRHSGDALLEVICVDNASRDSSAALITSRFPQVRLLSEPVNLGFAGGVNQGMLAAAGEIFVLLNQDCLVQEGWFPALLAAFAADDRYGILGATIYEADGAINHTGAHIRYPDAYGIHETDGAERDAPREVDYVTGALFAIRRAAWDAVGQFDEDFYPAYYEEVDYCYRARRRGFKVMHVPGARAVHYFTSTEWRQEPVRHSAAQHFARYRFVAKHFGLDQLAAFASAEESAIAAQTYHENRVGALLGARDILAELPAVLAARSRDLGAGRDAVRERALKVLFGRLLSRAYEVARASSLEPESRRVEASRRELEALQEEKDEVLARLYFRHPHDTSPESRWTRWWRQVVLRSLSILSLRDYRLLARLNTLHAAHLALLQRHIQLVEADSEDRLRVLHLLAVPGMYESR